MHPTVHVDITGNLSMIHDILFHSDWICTSFVMTWNHLRWVIAFDCCVPGHVCRKKKMRRKERMELGSWRIRWVFVLLCVSVYLHVTRMNKSGGKEHFVFLADPRMHASMETSLNDCFCVQTWSCHLDPCMCGGWQCIRTCMQMQNLDETSDSTFFETETGKALWHPYSTVNVMFLTVLRVGDPLFARNRRLSTRKRVGNLCHQNRRFFLYPFVIF